MDAGFALSYWGQGEVLRLEDKCGDAIPLYQKATELDRKFPEAELALGDCYVQTRQFDKGVAALTVGLGWGTKWRPRFLTALGRAEESRDSLRAAGIYFTTARQEAPDDATVLKELGEFYFRRGTWALAIQECQAAVDLDSTDIDIRFALGQALFYDQRYNDALDQYLWVTRRDADYAPAQLALGNLLFLSGAADVKRYAEARGPLEVYTRLKPNDPKGWSLLGRSDYYTHRPEALAELQKAEQLGDKSKEMYTVLGRYYADQKDWAKALDFFGRGDPTPRDLLLIGQMFVFQNNQSGADSIYKAIIARDSTTSDAKFAMTELGKGRFRAKDYPGAIATLNRRIALDPNSGEAYYYIGLSYKEMKQYPEALDALRRSAAVDSAKGERHFWLGILYAQQKDDENARASLERSVALDSTSKTAGVAYRQLGYYRLLQKDWTGAITLLERAVSLNDQDVQAMVWLGQAWQNRGDRAKAAEWYNKALKVDPNQPDAKKGLQILQAPPKGGTK
ncbi:MAG: tetratricopeptide repeat protein [Candidatus Eisenbacteria bacterium]|uniref:Tetratricopeptide repeat protein n=1 Tax=Eiseniibacteriota bacterium TaxID=2212470 RepID=A0A9D6LAF0_UNCEI|nr:tetratricopeptide repeat protein [Candidatus Eisenbacteria bacterium]